MFIEADHWSYVAASIWVYPNFSPQEIACRGSGKLKIKIEAMERLQALRVQLDRPMIINSAYRSPAHNKKIGGAPKSRHVEGDAFDVSQLNHDPHVFQQLAEQAGFTGFGFYPPNKGNFIHIDLGRARSWGQQWGAPQYALETDRFVRPMGYPDV